MFNGFIVYDAKQYDGMNTSAHYLIRTKRNGIFSKVGIQQFALYTCNVLTYPELIENTRFFDVLFSSIVLNTNWSDAQKRILDIPYLNKIACDYFHNAIVVIPEDAILKILFLLNQNKIIFSTDEYKDDYKKFEEILEDAVENGGFIVITKETPHEATHSAFPTNIDKLGEYYRIFVF